MSQSWGVRSFQNTHPFVTTKKGQMATNIRNWGPNARQKLNVRHFCFVKKCWKLNARHFEKSPIFYIRIYIDSKKKLKVDISRTFDWMEPCDFRGLGLNQNYKKLTTYRASLIFILLFTFVLFFEVNFVFWCYFFFFSARFTLRDEYIVSLFENI